MPANPTVPNTTTFTLQNVVSAVTPTTNDLNDCFNDADSAQFDPAYEGSKNQLLNFRNYGNQSAGSAVASLDGNNYDTGLYKVIPGGNLGYKAATQKSTSGSGTGFTANLYIDAVVTSGRTTFLWNGNYQITNAGTGYAVSDTIVFTITSMPTAEIVRDCEGIVLTVS